MDANKPEDLRILLCKAVCEAVEKIQELEEQVEKMRSSSNFWYEKYRDMVQEHPAPETVASGNEAG